MKNIWPLELKGLETSFSLQEDYFDIQLYCQEEMTLLSFFFKKGSGHGVIIWIEKCLSRFHSEINFSYLVFFPKQFLTGRRTHLDR